MHVATVHPARRRRLGSGLAALLFLAGCTSSGDEEAGVSTTEVSTTEVSTTTEGRLGGCPDRPEGSSSAEFSENGTFAVTIEGFDLEAATASVDVVQWLVGQAAADAYEAETGDDGGPPNDYYVLNENPRLREVSIDDDAVVRLVRLSEDGSADVSNGTLAELPDYLVAGFSSTIWWFTFDRRHRRRALRAIRSVARSICRRSGMSVRASVFDGP